MGSKGRLVEGLGPNGGNEDLKLFELEKSPIINVEINLELVPLFLYKTRGRSEESVEARNVTRTPDGQWLKQYVRVVGGREYGLPGPVDRDVHVGIMKLVHRAGGLPPDGVVSFTLYELLKVLGKNKGGNNYEKVRQSLDRVADCVIYAENAFYDNETEQFRTHRFTPWSVHFASTTKGKGRSTERHVLKFHELLVRSYNSGYLKTLDTDFFFSLKSPMAKSLYQLVDAKRRSTFSWTVGVQQLRQLIPMPESCRYDSKVREKVEPGLKELKRRGFLERADYEQRGEDQVICLRISREFVEARRHPQIFLSPREREVADALVRCGVTTPKAEQLVSDNGANHCLLYLKALPHQTNIANPAGWLVRYIENAWPVALPDEPNPQNDPPKPALVSSSQPLYHPGPREPRAEDHVDPQADVHADPQAERQAEHEVMRRHRQGEFDQAIRTFETIPFEEYHRFVATPRPVIADETENGYYVDIDANLYLCPTNSTDEHSRIYLCPLNRPT